MTIKIFPQTSNALDLIVPRDVKISMEGQVVEKKCPHCGVLVRLHPVRSTETTIEFYCLQKLVIHTRPRKPTDGTDQEDLKEDNDSKAKDT